MKSKVFMTLAIATFATTFASASDNHAETPRTKAARLSDENDELNRRLSDSEVYIQGLHQKSLLHAADKEQNRRLRKKLLELQGLLDEERKFALRENIKQQKEIDALKAENERLKAELAKKN